MTPVICRVKHDPPNSYGDCVRACVASLLDADASDVPHFYEDGSPDGKMRLGEWLGSIGYVAAWFYSDGNDPLEAVLEFMGAQNPHLYYMLLGRTEGGAHAVVCQGGAVVHDPNWYKTPLISGGDTNVGLVWSICVLVKL